MEAFSEHENPWLVSAYEVAYDAQVEEMLVWNTLPESLIPYASGKRGSEDARRGYDKDDEFMKKGETWRIYYESGYTLNSK